MVQSVSVDERIRSPAVVGPMLNLVRRADAMGIPRREEGRPRRGTKAAAPEAHETIQSLLAAIHSAGIAREIRLPDEASSHQLGEILHRVSHALDESPAPEYEWPRMTVLFQPEQDDLAELLGISLSSLRRYSSGERQTPDDVADRLHFLALLTGDLAGAYNDIGVRKWFRRKRALLDNRAPKDLLRGDWRPGEAGPERVRSLGRSLVAGSAT